VTFGNDPDKKLLQRTHRVRAAFRPQLDPEKTMRAKLDLRGAPVVSIHWKCSRHFMLQPPPMTPATDPQRCRVMPVVSLVAGGLLVLLAKIFALHSR
jgi:hypothetical protein